MGLTNYPNGISSFGIPVFGGLPATFGNVYFVDYAAGSDGNTGKSTTKAFKTYSKAVATSTSNNNDLILIDGYSAVAETAMVSMTNNRTHTIGLNGPFAPLGYGSGARISLGVTTAASDLGTFQNTGVRNTFTGIKFENSNTLSTCLYSLLDGGEYSRYFNCEVYKSSLLTTAGTAEFLCNTDSGQFMQCTFGDNVNERGASDKQRANVLVTRETITGKVARDCAFIDCLFLHKAAHTVCAYIYGANATDIERRLLLIRPVFINSVLATADPADCINFGAAQTQGVVLVTDPASVQNTAIGGASLGVYVTGAVPTQNTTGISVQVTS